MREIDFYMVDAFTSSIFDGNTAVVCPLKGWLPDEILLKMAKQHNQSETAFFVANQDNFELRWFTTQGEIDLCGHATLATAHVIFKHLHFHGNKIYFETRFVGQLAVTFNDDWLTLDFPAWETELVVPPLLLMEALGIKEYKEVRVARDYMVVLESALQLKALTPNINELCSLGKMICITAPGEDQYDFVSRFFCPGDAVIEDPVTGSAHSMLIPYWAKELNKVKLLAYQGGERGGELRCQFSENRVYISGQAVTYLIGKVFLEVFQKYAEIKNR